MSSTSTGAEGRSSGRGERPGREEADPEQLIVARIGAARGLRGEVRLDLRTDSPRARLSVGTVLQTEPARVGPLTVASLREDHGTWCVRFAEVGDRTSAEALTGVALLAPPGEQEDDAWYHHELVGLPVVLVDGTAVGTVEGFEHLPAQDLLVVRERTGERTLVPFVRAIVPEVDVEGGRVVLDPPGGLLAQLPLPEEPGHTGGVDSRQQDRGATSRGRDEAEPDEPED